jgi:hypothetical protein
MSAGQLRAAALAPSPAPPVAREEDGERVVEYQRGAGGDYQGHLVASTATPGLVRRLFLPQGYPDTVSPDYASSRRWAFLREVAGGAVSYFATSAVMGAVGFGAVGPITAGMAWMLRDSVDGAGKFAGSLLASRADQDPRGWAVRGDAVASAGLILESTLAVFPQTFLVTAPSANVVKAFGSTLRNAAAAPIEKHQARANNLGDVRSKNQNQQMLASVLGAGLGYGLDVAGRALLGPLAVPLTVGLLTAGSLYAQFRYAASLQMNDLTRTSLREVISEWLDRGSFPSPSPPSLGQRLRGDWRLLTGAGDHLELGSSLGPFIRDAARFDELRSLYAGRRYLLDWDGHRVRVALARDSGPEDQMAAVVQAAILERVARSPRFKALEKSRGEAAARRWAVEISLRATPRDMHPFLQELKARGWETERLILAPGSPRATWQAAPASALTPLDRQQLLALLQEP